MVVFVAYLYSPVKDKHTSDSMMESTKQFMFQCGCWRLDYMLSEREHTFMIGRRNSIAMHAGNNIADG